MGLRVIGHLLLLLGATSDAVAKQPTSILVSALRAERGVDSGLAGVLQDILLGELQKFPDFSAISEQDITDLIALEQRKELLDCVDDKCMAEIGGALGVEKILAGSVSKLGSSFNITLRFLNVLTGRVDRREVKQADGEDAAATAIREMLPALLGVAATMGTGPRALAQGFGRLMVVTKPSGAKVYVDSSLIGASPIAVPRLSTGEHVLTVDLADYVPITKQVDIVTSRETKVIESLARQTGTIQISTIPAGASIHLDHRLLGESPRSIRGQVTGVHTVKLTLADHASIEMDVRVGYQATATVQKTLIPLPGRILFTSVPPGAAIWLNAEKVGATNTTLALVPGKYKVAFTLDNHATVNEEIHVRPACLATMSAVLVPGESLRPEEALSPWRWIGLGSSILTSGAALGLGSLAWAAQRDVGTLPSGSEVARQRITKGERYAIAADIGFVATVVLSAVTYKLFSAKTNQPPNTVPASP